MNTTTDDNITDTILSNLAFGERTPSEMYEITIITLKQHLRNLATDEAWEKAQPNQPLEHIEQTIESLLSTKFTKTREFVSVEDDKIVVGIDAERIGDEETDRALALLLRIPDIYLKQRYEFGPLVEISQKIEHNN